MEKITLTLPTYLTFAIARDDFDDLDAQEWSDFKKWLADLQKRHGQMFLDSWGDHIGWADTDDYMGHGGDCQLATFEVDHA